MLHRAKTKLGQLKEFLIHERTEMVKYLLLKVDKEDWHGVADAAMDIREIDAKLELFKEINDGTAES